MRLPRVSRAEGFGTHMCVLCSHTIMSEVKFIMDSYGMVIDSRHLMLLSDLMTFKV